MAFDFETLLTFLVLLSGTIILIDKYHLKAIRVGSGRAGDKQSVVLEYAYSFFPVLLIVLCLRSFFFEPFRIPSGSLKPTLMVGDFVLVNKFSYGVRLPVLHTKILKISEPRVGDIAVFRWPLDPSIDYIKRIVGTPGDKISYVSKQLTINGKVSPQTITGTTTDGDSPFNQWPVIIKSENLPGAQHQIYERPNIISQDFYDLIIPSNQYFAMGDNRDDSSDSRYWGYVPENNLAGRAILIWFSWDNEHHRVRWERIGKHLP